jgi:thiol-disulfide isomerase/thioredoxin
MYYLKLKLLIIERNFIVIDKIILNRLVKFYGFLASLFVLLLFSSGTALGSEAMTVEAKYPGLASGILGSAKLEPMDKKTLLVSDGVKLSLAEINAAIKDADPKLRRQLEKNLFYILEQEAVLRILLNEAKKEGISKKGRDKGEIIRYLFERKSENVSVSDEEAMGFYGTNREMVGGMPFEEVRDSIKQYMLREKMQQAVDSYVASLKGSVKIRVNEKWVESQSRLALDNPVDKARNSKKPTMVEFGATGCIPCDMMQPILDNLRKNYPDRLNVVFVHVGEEEILAMRYGIRSIPVQVFFESDGKEAFRHVGFFPEKEVITQLNKIGVQ